MPGVKSVVFTRRIVAYHETFAVVGSGRKIKHLSAVWHEGVSGRNAEDIASTFEVALMAERDVKHVVYWLDNCTAQNKNWALYTMLVTLVNSGQYDFNDVTLKYFEPGHTFMSADSVHAGVEREMKRCKDGNVYDFNDFMKVVGNSSKTTVVQMSCDQFRRWSGKQSQSKLKKAGVHLDSIVAAQFRKGTTKKFYYKKSHDAADYEELDFVMNKAGLNTPPSKSANCGVGGDKKQDIVSKLCPLMPESRQSFWTNLPTIEA